MRNCLIALLVAILPTATACERTPRAFVLAGTVVTPERVIPRGWILVEGRVITRVADRPIDRAGAQIIDTGGIIVPGLIDLHNHVPWNVFPRWSPQGRYPNREAWLSAPVYLELLAGPRSMLQRRHACDMNLFGEVRALVGGVTSIQSAWRRPCIAGLVRNLDYDSGLYSDRRFGREPTRSLLDVNELSPREARRTAAALEAGEVKALFVHVGEARADDPSGREEFAVLVRRGLLTSRTVIVHGTGFGSPEFDAMQEHGAALVWSPRSNMELYGETTNVTLALERGIPVALAPDWAVTGSSNMLDELRYASDLSAQLLGAPLDDELLVRMVTEAPARLAGIDDKVGSIREGLYADLLVVRGDARRPYRTLVRARPPDVQLVVIGGEAVYGTPALMQTLGKERDGERLDVCGTVMAIDVTADGPTLFDWRRRFASAETRLRAAMQAARPGTALAPVAECDARSSADQPRE